MGFGRAEEKEGLKEKELKSLLHGECHHRQGPGAGSLMLGAFLGFLKSILPTSSKVLTLAGGSIESVL